jgi:hypothetical protein
MSCEVICCEVPEILDNFVEKFGGRYLDKLFSFLNPPNELNYYLAGYFEKILEMLFRRMTVPMMQYFNEAGTSLLTKFLNHMDNYSIMQIVQRLMLPHIPFSLLADTEPELSDEEKLLRQCNWSFSTDACQLLLDRMLEQHDAEVPLHISDLLITVLQLSPPETLVVSFLCEPACCKRLIAAAVAAPHMEGEGQDPGDIALPGDAYSTAISISLAAISVLESLNSRLFESSLPYDLNASQQQDGAELVAQEQQLEVVHLQIECICNELIPYIPRLHAVLERYLVASPCKSLMQQGKQTSPRLGHRGLQLVKLVESIVRLGSSEVDDCFRNTGLFKTCLKLFYQFENNSFLHLAVQRIVITVLESDFSRR